MKKKPNIEQIFNALGDATRRKLLERVSLGPISVSRLAEPMGMSLAAVVQHLQILEESGLVKTEKSGRVRTCTIDPRGLEIAAEWIEARRSSWARGFDELANLLAEDGEN